MFTRIVNQDIDLVFLHHSHASELFTLFKSNKLYLSRWLAWPSRCKEKQDFTLFISSALRAYSQGTALHCGIRHNDKLIGCISLNQMDLALKKAEITYWISKEFAGQGIMSTVCRNMLELAFISYNLEKVEACVATQNIPSRKIHQNLGFELEGILKRAATLNDTVIDHAQYGLLYKDYIRMNQNTAL